MKCPVCGEHACPCYRSGFEDGLDDENAGVFEDEEEEEEDDIEFERRQRG